MKKNNKIPFKSQLCALRTVKERNKKFDTLSSKNRAKEIAFDALQMLMKDHISAAQCSYWEYDLYTKLSERNALTVEEELKTIDKNFDLSTLSGQNCYVCARGAATLAAVDLLGAKRFKTPLAKFADEYDSVVEHLIDDIPQGNDAIFKDLGIPNYQDMEAEYEYDEFDHPYENNTNEKLANILCNVIANGDFDYNDATDYITKWNINLKDKSDAEKHKITSL